MNGGSGRPDCSARPPLSNKSAKCGGRPDDDTHGARGGDLHVSLSDLLGGRVILANYLRDRMVRVDETLIRRSCN